MSNRTVRRQELRRWAALAALALIWGGCAAAAPALEDIAKGVRIDPDRISVSGISSGGFMAHQFHVAHSDHIMGAGIVAGGPYFCARGSMLDAVTRCSQFVLLDCKASGLSDAWCKKTDLSPQNPAEVTQAAAASFKEAKQQEEAGRIARLTGLKGAKVYLFSGIYDSIVPQGVMDALYEFYTAPDKAALQPGSVRYNRNFPAPHTMVRDDFGNPTADAVGKCPKTVAGLTGNITFIDNCEPVAQEQQQGQCVCPASGPSEPCPPADKQASCRDLSDVDLAGGILHQIYGAPALEKGRAAVEEDEIQAFDQSKVFGRFSDSPRNALLNASMAKEGYIFIPDACRQGQPCPLHIAFHGCLQGGKTDRRPGHSGNLYSKFAGYNEWAKANGIIVLYPQAEKGASPPVNPQGCWDWWGQDYTHEYYHTQRGTQVKAVAQMVDLLAGTKLLPVPK